MGDRLNPIVGAESFDVELDGVFGGALGGGGGVGGEGEGDEGSDGLAHHRSVLVVFGDGTKKGGKGKRGEVGEVWVRCG